METSNLLLQIRDKYLSFKQQQNYIIATFPDFLTFYTIWATYHHLFYGSDNDDSFIQGGVQIQRIGQYVTGSCSYDWFVIPLFRLETIVVDNKDHTRVAIYWKWLHIMRMDNDIVSSFYDCMDILLFNSQYITLSRIDVTTDASKLDFSVKCNINTKYAPIFRNNITKVMETKYYGKKSDPVMVRMYNKKVELNDKWYSHLYPEYDQYDNIMRYEIVLRGRGIPKDMKKHFSSLESLRPLLTWDYTDDISINSLSLAREYHKKGTRTNKKLFVDFNAYLNKIKDKYDMKQIWSMLDNIYDDFKHTRTYDR